MFHWLLGLEVDGCPTHSMVFSTVGQRLTCLFLRNILPLRITTWNQRPSNDSNVIYGKTVNVLRATLGVSA
jgi:hypothetical protein